MSPIYVQIVENAYPFRIQLPTSFAFFLSFVVVVVFFLLLLFQLYTCTTTISSESINKIAKFAVSLLLPLLGDAIAI